ncbi:arginase family protein [Micromonospora sp. R77]|uniref:arginase family protein n=1 Tax=Micromonospora sp. R77 TaxID=2925836 RepID=UPI001F60882E|nr:arginase family protein [Micromonospora sp. R77]MCI4063139.1 arginase family protein [Micromonospora sp. R77]
MTTILVPYHQDEQLPPAHFPLPDGQSATVVADLPAGEIWSRLVSLYSAVADAVAASDAVPTVVSGDCLVALGTVAGVQRAGLDPAIVWFDAHGDVHTLETTTSGYLGGLSLRLVLGAHPELVAQPLGLRPVAEERAVLVDARDLDPAEADFLAGGAVRRVPVAELAAGSLPDGPIVLHVDVDVVDAAVLPGLLFPAPDGPSADDVVAACRRVVATGRVVAVDIACPWTSVADERVTGPRAELLARLTALG